MQRTILNRRSVLAGAATAVGSNLLGVPAFAKGNLTAAIYPGNWDE